MKKADSEIVINVDDEGKTGFTYALHALHDHKAKRPGHESIVKLLMEHQNNDKMLNVSFQSSCKHGWFEVVDFILKQPNVNIVEECTISEFPNFSLTLRMPHRGTPQAPGHSSWFHKDRAI